jgi:hypothetical protein
MRKWWGEHFPDLPIIEGHHDVGLFNRSAAVNLASRMADEALGAPWEVALIVDADVIGHPPNITEAIQRAYDTGQMVVAFETRYNLNRYGTQRIMEGYKGSWRPYILRSYKDQHSSIIAVPRRLYDAIGGFDEGFAGWGQEDTAFAIAAETFAGPLIHIPGEVWHLYHAGAPEGKRGTPSAISNQTRVARYRASWGNKDAVKALVAEGLELAGVRNDPHGDIPRIFHRTIPVETTPEVEAYWASFQEMHPGWRFMTHQEPINPDDWPIVGKYLVRAKTGATRGDLIRLEALWRYGGIYVDSDVEPYRSFEPLIRCSAFAAYEDRNSVPNAIMGATPEHPAIRECLDLAIKRLVDRKSVWEIGPGVTTKVLVGRTDVLLLPPGSFYPYHYREKERREEPHRDQQPWAFAAHHWAGSWLKEKKAS